MAPEVVKCQPYNESADVFSFGVLLWQMISCLTPYENFTIPMYERMVVENGHRPHIRKSWPKELVDLVKCSWSANPRDRPTLDEAKNRVKMFILSDETGKQIEFDVDLSKRSVENNRK